MKICGGCKKNRMKSSFSKGQFKNSSSLCRFCCYKYNQTYIKKFPEKYKQKLERSNETYRKKVIDDLGIDKGFYDRKLKEQDNRCAICGSYTYDKTGRRFAIDHCHITGHVRGLLCNGCNLGIGRLQDSEQLLINAIAYLKRYSVEK